MAVCVFYCTTLLSLWGLLSFAGAQCNNDTELRTAFATYSSVLQSPFYPHIYPSDKDCRWLITARSSGSQYVVKLQTVVLDLETSVDCSKDVVTIYDGASDTSNIVARLCDHQDRTTHIETFFSTGSDMLVRLTTDSKTERSGFYFRYRSVHVSEAPTPDPGLASDQVVIWVMTGIAVGVTIILIITVIIACRRKKTGRGQPGRSATELNIHDMDNPVLTGLSFRETNSRGVRDNEESTLPPNYSTLFVRNGSVGTQQSVPSERGDVTREASNMSSAPPQYTDSMINLFPPLTPTIPRHDSPSTSQQDAVSATRREDSIPAPSTPHPERPPLQRQSHVNREDSIPPPSAPYPGQSSYPRESSSHFTREDSRPLPFAPYPDWPSHPRQSNINREDSIPPPSTPYPGHPSSASQDEDSVSNPSTFNNNFPSSATAEQDMSTSPVFYI